MFNFFGKSDDALKLDVINEIMFDPSFNSSQVDISVQNGVIKLTGTVPHYVEKISAKAAVQRVSGVKDVDDRLEVKPRVEKTDDEMTTAAKNALKWNYSAPDDVQVLVRHGWIELSGEAEWDYQRTAAKNAVQELLGVIGVTSHITLKSKNAPSENIKADIQEALLRSREEDIQKVDVSVRGQTVVLSGRVHSFAEIVEAELTAWKAAGVNFVETRLEVVP